MDGFWHGQIDAYCERLGPGLWAEPVNLITNAAFVLVAAALWPQAAGRGTARLLCALLGAIGIGSALFHSFATPWAALADVAPIVAFVLVYLYALARELPALGLGPRRRPRAFALGVTVLCVPLLALAGAALGRIGWLGGSGAYVPVALLIAGAGLLLARRAPRLARGLAAGAGLLALSLTFRTLDLPLCPLWPRGTHFAWHLLNAVLLGWMIHLYLRHRAGGALDAGPPGR